MSPAGTNRSPYGCSGARCFLALALTSATLTVGTTATAQGSATARLVYQRGPGAERCPDEDVLRDAVRTRLGYDPFRDERATIAIHATITREGSSLRGEIESHDASGERVGARRLSAPRRDCDELATALALAISLAIDPLGAARVTRVAPAPPQPAPPQPAPPQPAPPQPAPPQPVPSAPPPLRPSPPATVHPSGRAEHVELQAGVGLAASYGITPSATAAPLAQFAVRIRSFSLGLEARVDLPGTATRDGVGTVSAFVAMASLLPCVNTPLGPLLLSACANLGAGAMGATATSTPIRTPRSSFFAVAGVRIALQIPLVARRLWLRPFVEGLAVLTPTSLEIRGTGTDGIVWISPPLAISVGAAVAFDFL